MTEFQRTYGGALYELSREEGKEEETLSELASVSAIIEGYPDFTKLMGVVSIPLEERLASLDKVFRGRVCPYLLNFMKLLSEKGRFGELSGCLKAYRARYNADNGIAEAEAVSAGKLSEEEASLLREKLEKLSGKKIVLTLREDPSILGGVRVSMEGKQYDGSVRHRLEEIEKSLADRVL